MLKIRLARVGRKHDPSYRVIVTEKGRGPQTGAYHEKLGTYDARSDEYELKEERVEHWLSEGAQPSDTVHNLLVKAEIIDDDTINPLPNKSPVSSDEEAEEDEESAEKKDEDDAQAADSSSNESGEDEEDSEDSDADSKDDDSEDNESESDSNEENEDTDDSDDGSDSDEDEEDDQ